MVAGQIARAWYCGWNPPIGQELQRETIGVTVLQRLRELEQSTAVLFRILEKAQKTAAEISRKGHGLKSRRLMDLQDKEDFRELGKILLELETLMDRLAKTHTPLRLFSQMSKVFMHHLRGGHIAEVGRETAECYRLLMEGVTLCRAWIEFTFTLVKPKTIQKLQSNLGLAKDPSLPV
jgi:hypothetical protein